MSDPAHLLICLTTVSSAEEAMQISNQLLDESLAACVQVEGPIQSYYVWDGKRQRDEEYRLVIKTSDNVWPRLKIRISELHSYDEPQILSIVVDNSSDGYRNWVFAKTSSSQ